MCVAYKTVCYPPCRRRQLDDSAKRHRREPAPYPIEADDRGLRAPPCQLVDRPPGTRQVAEPRGGTFLSPPGWPGREYREPSGTSRLTGIIGVRKRRRCPAADD